jgi:hypothetical protein
MAPGEITIVFSYGDEPPIGPMLTEMTAISVTPTHARRIQVMLSEMLRAYEENFGQIPAEGVKPPNFAEVGERIEERIKSGEVG